MAEEKQLIQDAANMGVLARQAIGNGFPTMEVDPKICANVALLVERLMQTHDEAPAIPVPTSDDAAACLAHAKEEGRREAIGEHAQEKADLLQRVTELEAALPESHELLPPAAPATADQGGLFPDGPAQDGNEATSDGNEFKGPGQ